MDRREPFRNMAGQACRSHVARLPSGGAAAVATQSSGPGRCSPSLSTNRATCSVRRKRRVLRLATAPAQIEIHGGEAVRDALGPVGDLPRPAAGRRRPRADARAALASAQAALPARQATRSRPPRCRRPTGLKQERTAAPSVQPPPRSSSPAAAGGRRSRPWPRPPIRRRPGLRRREDRLDAGGQPCDPVSRPASTRSGWSARTISARPSRSAPNWRPGGWMRSGSPPGLGRGLYGPGIRGCCGGEPKTAAWPVAERQGRRPRPRCR